MSLRGCGARSVEASHAAHPEHACSSQRCFRHGASLEAGEDPRSCRLTKLSLGAHLFFQVLFGNGHKTALLLQNRQHLSRIHFLSNNSLPEKSVTVQGESQQPSQFNLHTGFVQDTVPALPPLQHWHFPGWQPKGCLGRHSCGQKAKAGLHYICSKRSWMESSGLHLGKGAEPTHRSDTKFVCNERAIVLMAGNGLCRHQTHHLPASTGVHLSKVVMDQSALS